LRRILISGDRHWECPEVAEWILQSLLVRHGPGFVVVHGAARGVDSTFAAACDRLGIVHEPHPADWEARGKGAGPRRNQEMVDLGADFAIAVHRDIASSKGTGDCVRRCHAAGISVFLVDGLYKRSRLSPPAAVMPCPVCDGVAVKMSRPRSWFCATCEVEFERHEGQRK
jgi:hypothetical protein